MTSLEVEAGTTIIQQGDTDAKTFYVLGLGSCEVLLHKPEWGKDPRAVLTYESGRYLNAHVVPQCTCGAPMHMHTF